MHNFDLDNEAKAPKGTRDIRKLASKRTLRSASNQQTGSSTKISGPVSEDNKSDQENNKKKSKSISNTSQNNKTEF